MILYPTETLYAVGVHALDAAELDKLYALKERDRSKAASWLVRGIDDVYTYAEVPPIAIKIAEHFLPGSLTLVLKALPHVGNEFIASDRTIGFRISSDPAAQELIEEFMQMYSAPLTCTSANVSGAPTLPTVGEILQQFGPRASMIDRVIDGGLRKGLASTIVRVVGPELTILREGNIRESDIRAVLEM
jgi:L-threonylcarbamoyladenylate synthase